MNNLVCKLSSSDPVSKISNKKMKWMEKHFLPIRWKETLSFQALNKKLLCVCSMERKEEGISKLRVHKKRERERENWGRTSVLPEREWIRDRLMHFLRKTHRWSGSCHERSRSGDHKVQNVWEPSPGWESHGNSPVLSTDPSSNPSNQEPLKMYL